MFNEITPEQFDKSPFKLIGKDWMLITAKKGEKTNTMTASWGGFGVMWNINVAYIVLRPQRYTKEFIDNSDEFSLSFFDNSFKSTLGYLGSVSGRDEDKITSSGLTLNSVDVPFFEEANTVVFCKKLYAQKFTPDCFIAEELNGTMYLNSDHHTLYIAEITKILVKE